MRLRKSSGVRRPSEAGPTAIEDFPRRVQVGDVWCQTIAIADFAPEVSAAWLAPLLSYAGPLDVSLHVEPIPIEDAARHLRRQLARLESTRRIAAKNHALGDPQIEAAAVDAAELAGSVARGDAQLFRVGLYITVRAETEESLAREVSRVEAICRSLQLKPQPVMFRARAGWHSTLPVGVDELKRRYTFDTFALAAAFPFASAEIEGSSGILYGRNATTGGLIFVDRFALENHNQVVLARSGAGKSYFAKTQILRSLCSGIDVLVIDPQNEYERLARAVGGTVVCLGADGARLNPLDLAGAGQPEALTEQALFVHAFLASVLGGLAGDDRAVLDRAILAAYERAGITSDPRTHACAPPVLGDVARCMRELPAGARLADRLEPFVTGSYRGLFNAATSVRPEGHLIVFSLRDLPDELQTPGTLLALEATWRRVTRGESRPRIVVIDEAWLLLRGGRDAAALFLQRLAKSARKHWCGLVAITQDAADVLASDLGQALITNAAHHVLLGQSPQAIDALARAFNLSEGEKAFLLTCDRGEGIIGIGPERAALQVVASEFEHRLATSDPAELAAMGGEP